MSCREPSEIDLENNVGVGNNAKKEPDNFFHVPKACTEHLARNIYFSFPYFTQSLDDPMIILCSFCILNSKQNAISETFSGFYGGLYFGCTNSMALKLLYRCINRPRSSPDHFAEP